jgi:competence protein CoiA
MKYALVEDRRVEAKPKLRGSCPGCGKETISKCGRVVIWHWAHQPVRHCDPWWEGETEWHRMWKNYFTSEEQEVVHRDSKTGEIHIADVKTKDGYVIELQNSPLEIDELRSRETFYDKMIWIVNGKPFRRNFHVLTPLPPPDSDLAQKLVILRAPRMPRGPKDTATSNPLFVTTEDEMMRGDNFVAYTVSTMMAGQSRASSPEVNIHFKIAGCHEGHFYLQWIRPRSLWTSGSKRVFIDIGEDIMFELIRFNESHLCVKAIVKMDFLRAAGASTIPPRPDKASLQALTASLITPFPAFGIRA